MSELSCSHEPRGYVILFFHNFFVASGVHRNRIWTIVVPSESARRCASVPSIPDICGTSFESFLKAEGEGEGEEESKR